MRPARLSAAFRPLRWGHALPFHSSARVAHTLRVACLLGRAAARHAAAHARGRFLRADGCGHSPVPAARDGELGRGPRAALAARPQLAGSLREVRRAEPRAPRANPRRRGQAHCVQGAGAPRLHARLSHHRRDAAVHRVRRALAGAGRRDGRGSFAGAEVAHPRASHRVAGRGPDAGAARRHRAGQSRVGARARCRRLPRGHPDAH